MTRPVTLDDLSAFNAELLALVQSGIALEQGLADLATSSNGRLAQLAGRLSQRMQQGESLPTALQGEGNAIPPIYGALVQAGVRSGRLTAALETAAELGQEVQLVRQQVGQALLAPLVLLFLSFLLTLLFGVDLLHRYRERGSTGCCGSEAHSSGTGGWPRWHWPPSCGAGRVRQEPRC